MSCSRCTHAELNIYPYNVGMKGFIFMIVGVRQNMMHR